MKRDASGEPQGAQQRSEKAVKEGDAEPELARADPLLELLCTFTAEEKAGRWKDVLYEHDVVSLDDLMGLAEDEEAWKGFHSLLAQQEPMLASKLNAWSQGPGLRETFRADSRGKQRRKRPISSCFLFRSFVLLRSLFWPSRHPWCEGG
jgi:hypothetical protein